MKTQRFDQCLPLILKHEGGYIDHPADRGGATNCGITQEVYDDFRVSKGMNRQPVIGLNSHEAAQIYKASYWTRGKCDRMPVPLDYVHFDGCVNHGVTQASKFLQRALGVEDDGKVGPVTLRAIDEEYHAGRIVQLCEAILEQRHDFYEAIVARRPNQSVFLKGWINRINGVLEVCYATVQS